MKVQIFVTTHHLFTEPRSQVFQPIVAGVATGITPIAGYLRDDVGDNISQKNNFYCELTAHYWAWKNVDLDYYGFCHYRRFFSFSQKVFKEDIYGSIVTEFLSEKDLELNADAIEHCVSGYDIILSEPFNVSSLGFKDLFDQYEQTDQLNINDLMIAVDRLKSLYPSYADSVDNYMGGQLFYPCLMYIMRRDIFYSFCNWLFPLLDEIEKRIDVSNYSQEGLRTIGHIAERFLGIFVTQQIAENENLKIKVLQRTLVLNPMKSTKPTPSFNKNNVPIVMCCSDYFVPYAAVTLGSILENTSELNNYDIWFMHVDISERNQKAMLDMVKDKHNAALHFINISENVKELKLIANNHVSVHTFYRLLANSIFSKFNKILYLDSDLIIRKDVAELFANNMEEKLLLASIDADHAGEYNGAIPNVKEYSDKILKLKKPYEYFQAGVILFNVDLFNKSISLERLLRLAQEKEYMYVDQDVLNIIAEGKVGFLSQKWNVLTDCGSFRINKIIKKAPFKLYKEYMEARRDPWIIHYAGFEKPWNSPNSDFSTEFWEVARNNPFYESILWRMSIEAVQSGKKLNRQLRNKKFLSILDNLLPKGSKRRGFAKKIYLKFFRN